MYIDDWIDIDGRYVNGDFATEYDDSDEYASQYDYSLHEEIPTLTKEQIVNNQIQELKNCITQYQEELVRLEKYSEEAFREYQKLQHCIVSTKEKIDQHVKWIAELKND